MCECTARPIGAEGLVALLEGSLDRVLLIDSRPFVEYNACHILEAVNVNCSKLMKRRLQQDKIQISELLQHSAKRKVCETTGVMQACHNPQQWSKSAIRWKRKRARQIKGGRERFKQTWTAAYCSFPQSCSTDEASLLSSPKKQI